MVYLIVCVCVGGGGGGDNGQLEHFTHTHFSAFCVDGIHTFSTFCKSGQVKLSIDLSYPSQDKSRTTNGSFI